MGMGMMILVRARFVISRFGSYSPLLVGARSLTSFASSRPWWWRIPSLSSSFSLFSLAPQKRHSSSSSNSNSSSNTSTTTTTNKNKNDTMEENHHYLLQQEIDQANAKHEGRLLICQVGDVGWGLITQCHFARGDVVMQARALEVMDRPTSHTVQLDWDKHVQMDLPARFVNHRCHSANLAVQENALGAFNYVAARDIHPGEELNWDYVDSEYDMNTPFKCVCGDAHCRKLVRGWRYSPEDALRKDPAFLPKYRQVAEMDEEQSSTSG
uniref:SET domain-containing protein n=1 Tax=Amphora coffeiformis TaxID=265554 RepID=A0A7S3P443_9STRA|mmetsp:Transcript_5827/g.11400  ORF Transcript_5827/g.11400 Transcript_5827/m.11400 type:complete len:268 (+) Transcript_5827:153-956(+)